MRDDVLSRIREALRSGQGPVKPAEPAAPKLPLEEARRIEASLDTAGRIACFLERAESSGSTVHRVTSRDQLQAVLQRILETASSVAVASREKLEQRLGVSLTELVPTASALLDAETIPRDRLFTLDAALTGADLAVAETGSILLGTNEEAGRIVSLVPEVHVALVWPDQIQADLLDAASELAAILPQAASARSRVLISGPSKTADIEIQLVVGVHGPGELHIILVDRNA